MRALTRFREWSSQKEYLNSSSTIEKISICLFELHKFGFAVMGNISDSIGMNVGCNQGEINIMTKLVCGALRIWIL
jgi:hypothetical protein